MIPHETYTYDKTNETYTEVVSEGAEENPNNNLTYTPQDCINFCKNEPNCVVAVSGGGRCWGYSKASIDMKMNMQYPTKETKSFNTMSEDFTQFRVNKW